MKLIYGYRYWGSWITYPKHSRVKFRSLRVVRDQYYINGFRLIN